jgi:hypothetical protein
VVYLDKVMECENVSEEVWKCECVNVSKCICVMGKVRKETVRRGTEALYDNETRKKDKEVHLSI